jgi:Na+-transporting methylmalonyl-CoA/oxaloacetate decarboxylase gamma subunit
MSIWWGQVSETVISGFQITVVGMLLVFFTLGLVILALVLLTRLPGLRSAGSPEQESPEQPRASAPHEPPILVSADAEHAAEQDDLAQVAAMAVAILRSRRRATVQHSARRGQNAWKSYGRAQQLGL